MVQIGDLDIQLVDAETKLPFKEHLNKGKVYVEVEPNVEYYISLRKIKVSEDVLVCQYYVDGKGLDYSTPYYPSFVNQESPHYRGLWSFEDGVSTMKALKFQKPKLLLNGESTQNANKSPTIMMGQVKVDVFAGVYKGQRQRYQIDRSSGFETASADRGATDKKKNLRSGGGKATDSSTIPTEYGHYDMGSKLYSITLNYCAASGLVLCGVLPKPRDRWEHHRMLYPYKPTSNKRMRLVPTTTEDGKAELFDLSTLESDDDDDEDKDNDTSSSQPKQPVAICLV